MRLSYRFLFFILVLFSCQKNNSGSQTSTSTNTTNNSTGNSSSDTTYNTLFIPPTLSGTTFNLSLGNSTKQFFSGNITSTYSYNSQSFWGPTLIMNKGDNVQLNVTNTLSDTTTVHWHGFHIPAIMDGGPHQKIAPGSTWSPHFQVLNNASTFWYHPHLHQKAYEQISLGAGGFIIVKDPIETALNLPRTYGVDDIPLVLTSRRFTSTNAIDLTNHAYGDYLLANGTLYPKVTLPKQYVRFRILNAEIERGYNIGFSDNRTFYVIGNDGGLLNAPVPVTRVKLVVGERYEILVNLSGDAVGSTLRMMAYNSNQEFGFGGSEQGTTGEFGSLLNNKDFEVLHIQVGSSTSSPITSIPSSLTTNTYLQASDATNSRTVDVTGGQGGSNFSFDNNFYNYVRIDQNIKLGTTEKWTIVNNNIFSHAFHIHDVQFKLVSRSSGSIASYESGWKDTFYLHAGESVSFVAKFSDFADSSNPFMYHCHFPNHEDGGLMAQFLVNP